MEKNTFSSEFADVEYFAKDKAVLLTWKKFARIENYRNPTEFALSVFRNTDADRFVIDARNGFEDDPADVEWGFSYLLPEISKTGCKTVCFIMEKVTEIEGEMDMWTAEFMKYFKVFRVDSYDSALKK